MSCITESCDILTVRLIFNTIPFFFSILLPCSIVFNGLALINHLHFEILEIRVLGIQCAYAMVKVMLLNKY